MTQAQVTARISASANRQTPPFIVLAKSGDKVLGAAEIKIREMDINPQYEFWLGGVYVSEEARGQGIATALVNEAIHKARDSNITALYLQTENLDGGLYKHHGFQPVEQVDYNGVKVLIMVKNIK